MVNSSNKKIGNDFEAAFCELLFENGFWVHNMAQNHSGQPADVIAVKNGKAYLIDCKVCSNDRFLLTRIEENQILSMDLWWDCGNGSGWFALLVDGKVFMISHPLSRVLEERYTTLSVNLIREYSLPIRKWLMSCK